MKKNFRRHSNGQKNTAKKDLIKIRKRSKTREQKDHDWEFVKNDVYYQRPHEWKSESSRRMRGRTDGTQCFDDGFQGQRQWTDFYPNGDFAEALLNTSFDWDGPREPYILATENDVLNGIGMLFMKLLTNRAQIFADVRTYWTQRLYGKQQDIPWGKSCQSRRNNHLINSGAACLDACGEAKEVVVAMQS